MTFRLKIIAGIVAIEALLLVVLVIGSLGILRASSEDELQKRADTMVRSFAIMARDGIAYMETSLLKAAIEEVSSQFDVSYARIRQGGSDGSVLMQRGEDVLLRKPFDPDPAVSAVSDGVYDVSAPVFSNGRRIGEVEIGFSTEYIRSSLANSMWKLILVAALGVLLTVACTYALGNHLTRQLRALRATSHKLANGAVGSQVPVSGDIEIADTLRAFNQMSVRLKAYYDEVVRNERRIRSVFDNVALAAITFDADGNVREFNAPAEWIFGHASEEIVGQPFSDLLAAPSQPAFQSLLAENRATASEERMEYQLVLEGQRKDGRQFPSEMTLSQYFFEGTVHYTALVRDISSERALETKSLQAESVFENIGDAIVITDPENRVVQINPAYTRITGFEAGEVIGHVRQISRTESLDQDFFATIWENLNENGIWTGEVWTTRKNGEIFPTWMTTTELSDENGEVTNYINTFRDITESKKVERIKSEFVSTVSHELRTPVTSIRGSLGILQSGAFGAIPEKAEKMIGMAVSNCNRLIDLINDILDMEKIESGTVAFKMVPIEVAPFLEEATSACMHYGEDRGVRLVVKNTSGKLQVFADKGRLMQVMANLISNAVKFSPDNGTVRIALDCQGDEVRIGVSDDGPGIPKAFREHMFEKFTQGDASDGRVRGGTGLGLSIAKAIVEMHEGSIDYVTEEGVGTTFYIVLRMHEAASQLFEHKQKIAS